jgi:hypothetical protein
VAALLACRAINRARKERIAMKKPQQKKNLVLSKQTVRTIAAQALEGMVAGASGAEHTCIGCGSTGLPTCWQ